MKEGIEALIRAGNLCPEGEKRVQAYISAMHAWRIESVAERLEDARRAFANLHNDDERRLANALWHIEDRRGKRPQIKPSVI